MQTTTSFGCCFWYLLINQASLLTILPTQRSALFVTNMSLQVGSEISSHIPASASAMPSPKVLLEKGSEAGSEKNAKKLCEKCLDLPRIVWLEVVLARMAWLQCTHVIEITLSFQLGSHITMNVTRLTMFVFGWQLLLRITVLKMGVVADGAYPQMASNGQCFPSFE